MNRRDFLKAGSLGTAAMALNGVPLKALADVDGTMRKIRGASDRIFVFVVLSGGNDGLNTVIPLDKYSELSAARSNVMIPSNQVLNLNGVANVGLHPSMTGLRDMYNSGLVNITQSVGYPNFNYSHFRATDIFNTASDANSFLDTGWVGRYLETRFPGAPNAYPNADFLDPLAVQIGNSINNALTSSTGIIGYALSDLNNFYNIINTTGDPAPNTLAGHELTFIRYISLQTQSYTQTIQQADSLGSNPSPKWTGITGNNTNKLADQLKIVSKLINGGLGTPIYFVEIGGFDTHSAQVSQVDHSIGDHADLLKNVSDAIAAFYDDLKLAGNDQKVAGCTITEFGRRIKSNNSVGTDHGSSSPLISFGRNVISGINGVNPTLPTAATVSDQLPMQHDFRSVYASILQDWFGVTPTTAQTILGGTFNTLPIFKANPTDVEQQVEAPKQASIYPNPMRNSGSLEFVANGGPTQIKLYSDMGKLIGIVYENELPAGARSIAIERNGLPAGQYFYVIESGSHTQTVKAVFID
jgi:uncharacterized protein (DUF1501 family)